jgi:cell division protein FtsI/penicillin-binding protein 2
MSSRFLPAVAAVLISLSLNSSVPDLAEGQWVPEAAGAARKKASSKAPPKAPRHAHAVRSAVPSPSLPDDPSVPLPQAWGRRVDAFLKAARPAHGAFVALDPATGKVLVSAEYAAPGARFQHPATDAGFPAASVFKIVTSSALLENTTVGPGTTTCYHGGSSWLDVSNIADSRRDKACRTLSAAFAHSTNAIFGKLAVKHLDADVLLRQAESLGFNHQISTDGLRTRSVAHKALGDLALARMAAGFINANMSPLAGAVMAAIIANDGVRPAGISLDGVPGTEMRVLKPETVERLRGMMVETSSGGTGTKYFSGLPSRYGGGRVAVKSGTLNSRDGSGLHNTWMVGFFPASKPELAFAALVSSNGPGPVKAGHLARWALETFVTLKKNRLPGS